MKTAGEGESRSKHVLDSSMLTGGNWPGGCSLLWGVQCHTSPITRYNCMGWLNGFQSSKHIRFIFTFTLTTFDIL